MLLVIIVLVLLFGGFGGYWGYSRNDNSWGHAGGFGLAPILVILLVAYLLGAFR